MLYHEILPRLSTRNVEFLEVLLDGSADIIKAGTAYRINPCVFNWCGHNDCLTFREGIPAVNCFSCRTKLNLIEFTEEFLHSREKAIKFIEDFFKEKIIFGNNDIDDEQKCKIREYAAKHYHRELMVDKTYLDYQLIDRAHSLDVILTLSIGKSGNYKELYDDLIAAGFDPDEIKEANVWIPDGLFVYPYFDKFGRVQRFNTKNPFKITNSVGIEIQGFSTGKKILLRSESVTKKYVMVVEGENDLAAVLEASAESVTKKDGIIRTIYTASVVAMGGNPSAEQIGELREFDVIYTFFDNDDAGLRDTQQLNDLLPDKVVKRIVYDSSYKDPDEYFKKNPSPLSMAELMKDALPLVNDGYYIEAQNHKFLLKNRSFVLSFEATKKNNKGIVTGDFNFTRDGQTEATKFNTTVDKIGQKYIKYVQPLNDALERFYNHFEDDDFNTLLEKYYFSSNGNDILSRLASIVKSEQNDTLKQEMLNAVKSKYYYQYDAFLREVNALDNTSLDPNVTYPVMPASQAFNVAKNRAYMYFNQKKQDKSGLYTVPTLLTNDKRKIDLDTFRRKTNQYLLIVDETFQLHQEVPTAIMEDAVCSLKNKYADQFINGEIDAEDVAPDSILWEMEEYFRLVFYTEDEVIYKVLSLFAYGTYFYQLFKETPYLLLNSEKGSGKTTLNALLSKLCFCCRLTVGVSEAALFRSISLCGGTFILDEMENLNSRDKAADSLMASVLKAGYSAEGNTLRMNMETGQVESFTLYGPKVISNIGGVEDVIADRCVKIPLKKYPASATNQKMSLTVFMNNYAERVEETASKACISALVNFQEIYRRYVNMKLDMGSARNSQILRPLFTIAAIAGLEWEKAIQDYYERYIDADKAWDDANSPEGNLKKAFAIIAEDAGSNHSDWIDEYSLKEFISRIGDEITVNTFVIKLLLDTLDGGKKNYSMGEIDTLIRRVYPRLVLGKRTTVRISNNENWVKMMNNRDIISTYKFTVTIKEQGDVTQSENQIY